MGAGECVGARAGAAGGWAPGRGVQRARGRAEQAARRCWGVGVRRGARSAAGRAPEASRQRAAGAGRMAGCVGRAAWACLCAQAGRVGWSAGLVLVHSAPGSVLTQSLTGSTQYFS